MGEVTEVKKEDVFERKTTVLSPWADPAFNKVDNLGGEPGFKVDDIPERLGLVQEGQRVTLAGGLFIDLGDTPNNYGEEGDFVQTDGEGRLNYAPAISHWVKSGSNLYYNKGNVAIGKRGPTERLDVEGSLNISGVYKIATETILHNPGTKNLYCGVGTIGAGNSTGQNNVFLGYEVGYSVTSGHNNAFAGYFAGRLNTTADEGALFGYYSGYYITTSPQNACFGAHSGKNISTGQGRNACFGYNSGGTLNIGYFNTFVGGESGGANVTSGYANTCVGYNAEVAAAASHHRIAIGYNAISDEDNLCVIGGTLLADAVSLAIFGSDFRFKRARANGPSQVTYQDTGGGQRLMLLVQQDQDIVEILNRAANGTVEIHANTSTAGGAGDTLVATFEDDKVTLSQALAIGASSGTFPNAGASFHLAALTGNINAYITNDVASGIPALWLIRDYTGTPSYGGMGSTGNNTLELSTTGSFDDSGFILAGNDVTIVGTLDCGAITSSGNLLITSASSKSIITTVTEIAEITECILNSDTASWSTFSKGSAYAGTTHGGLTGNNQVGMEAQNASSFYIGCNAAAPIIFCQGRVEKVRIDISGNVGMGQTTFGTNATKTLALGTGVAPTTSPTNCFQMYSADIAAGHAAPHIRNENDTIIKLYQQALIADPAGQANDLDSEARTAIDSILDILENNGLMASA